MFCDSQTGWAAAGRAHWHRTAAFGTAALVRPASCTPGKAGTQPSWGDTPEEPGSNAYSYTHLRPLHTTSNRTRTCGTWTCRPTCRLETNVFAWQTASGCGSLVIGPASVDSRLSQTTAASASVKPA